MDREFGIIGLGRIGGGLARQADQKGWRVVGCDVAEPDKSVRESVEFVSTLDALIEALTPPRRIFIYIHAGQAIDSTLERLAELASPGDVLIDGGNSYWGDSIRRHQMLVEQGLEFVDLGTSGGLIGALTGACFMAGGSDDAVSFVRPILEDLCVPGGFVHAGGPGAGHYVKLVHNGVEFGMLQAIGEGVHLLEASELNVDVADTLECWRHGSVVRSWLIDLMAEAYRTESGLSEIPAWIEDTGEVNWLVQDAVRMEVPTPVITQSVIQLFASRDESRAWAKSVALMRRGFGGHKLGPIPALAEERRTARTGGIQEPDTP